MVVQSTASTARPSNFCNHSQLAVIQVDSFSESPTIAFHVRSGCCMVCCMRNSFPILNIYQLKAVCTVCLCRRRRRQGSNLPAFERSHSLHRQTTQPTTTPH